MPKVVVDVMLKAEISDPQGQAVLGALGRLGVTGVRGVRQGKRFEIEVDGPVDTATLDRLEEVAASVLANPVIEEFVVRAE